MKITHVCASLFNYDSMKMFQQLGRVTDISLEFLFNRLYEEFKLVFTPEQQVAVRNCLIPEDRALNIDESRDRMIMLQNNFF